MDKYFINFNEKNNEDLNLKIIQRPSIPSPKKRYTEKPIPGRDGILYEDQGIFDDIEIPIQFNFLSKTVEQFNYDYREIKKWINNIKDNKLKFSDDLGFFYFVNKATIDTSERILKKIGKFTVIFNCEPYQYLNDGQEPIKLPNTLYNSYEKTQPLYLISGEGVLTLNVNGKTVKANVGQNLKIDTKLGMCFREDGTKNNTALKGYYKELILNEGKNTFEFTTGFNINIVPRWRCI